MNPNDNSHEPLTQTEMAEAHTKLAELLLAAEGQARMIFDRGARGGKFLEDPLRVLIEFRKFVAERAKMYARAAAEAARANHAETRDAEATFEHCRTAVQAASDVVASEERRLRSGNGSLKELQAAQAALETAKEDFAAADKRLRLHRLAVKQLPQTPAA